MSDFLAAVAESLRQDFSDLPDVQGATRLVTRLVVAALLGGALGYERETRGKDAGLRTHMLICVGAALFVFVPQQLGISDAELARVIQGIVAGVGFIGGGAILKLSEERRVEGLTTAAGIWLTAGIGIAAGMGRMASATAATVIALIVLAALGRVSQWLSRDAKIDEARESEA